MPVSLPIQPAGSVRRRRHHWPVLLASLLALGAVAGAAEVATVSGHPNWPPFSWQEGERLTGVGVELAGIVFGDVGIAVRPVVHGNWKRVQLGAEGGELDAVVAIYATAERRRYLAYPETAYTTDSNMVWVTKGKEFHYAQWSDLVGKRGTAMQGESYGEQFDRFIHDRLVMDWVNTPEQNLKKLTQGWADFYPFSLYGGQIQVRQLGYEGRVVALPRPISTEGVHLALAKKSPLLKYLPQLEAAIRKRRADGTVERLLAKYIALAAGGAPAGP